MKKEKCNMKKKALALILGTAMVFSLTACGGSGTNDTADTSADTTADAAEETPAAEDADTDAADGAADTSGQKYAVILKTQATDFWISMWEGVENYAAENGLAVDLYAAQSDTDYEAQLSILESCINSGDYAGIAIAPCSGVNMITGVKAANNAGITIVNIDEQFDQAEMESQGATCVGYVSSDNVAVGHLGAEYISSLLEAGSQVAVIEGIAGNASSEDRASGAKAAFEEAGMELIGSKACDWDMQTALDTAATWITQYPDLKAIYCCNDGMAMGVMQAIANAGKTGEILLCGTDGDSDAIEAVAAGNMTATVAQDSANIGVVSLQLLVDACTDASSYTASAAPEKTPVDAILVNSENAANF